MNAPACRGSILNDSRGHGLSPVLTSLVDDDGWSRGSDRPRRRTAGAWSLIGSLTRRVSFEASSGTHFRGLTLGPLTQAKSLPTLVHRPLMVFSGRSVPTGEMRPGTCPAKPRSQCMLRSEEMRTKAEQ